MFTLFTNVYRKKITQLKNKLSRERVHHPPGSILRRRQKEKKLPNGHKKRIGKHYRLHLGAV